MGQSSGPFPGTEFLIKDVEILSPERLSTLATKRLKAEVMRDQFLRRVQPIQFGDLRVFISDGPFVYVSLVR